MEQRQFRATDVVSNRTIEFLVRLKLNNEFWYVTLLDAATYGPKYVKKVIDNLYEHRSKIFEFDRRGLNVFEICLYVKEFKDQLALIPKDVWEATRTRRAKIMAKDYQHLTKPVTTK